MPEQQPNFDTALALEIVNPALMRAGAGVAITSLTQANTRARYANAVYDQRVRQMLSEHRWEFATRQAQLDKAEEVPTFDWDYQFNLPTDPPYLRMVRFSREAGSLSSPAALVWPSERTLDYQVQGLKIFTSWDTVFIEYVGRVGERYFSPLFREALEIKLAEEFARSLTKRRETADDLLKQLIGDPARGIIGVLQRAKSVDSRNSPNRGIVSDAGLLSVR